MLLGKPLLEALDRMGYGGILLDTFGQVLLINHAATRILQENAPGDDRPSGSDAGEALKALLRFDASARLTMKDDAWVVIRRDETGERPLVLHTVPIINQALAGPQMILIIVDLWAHPHLVPATLQKIFGLTPAEAKLAIEIAHGQTLDDIAAEHRVSPATARKQLASVLSKTYTHRQAELVALLVRASILP